MLFNVTACVACTVLCVALVVRTWGQPMAFTWYLFGFAFLFLLRDVVKKGCPEELTWLVGFVTAILGAAWATIEGEKRNSP